MDSYSRCPQNNQRNCGKNANGNDGIAYFSCVIFIAWKLLLYFFVADAFLCQQVEYNKCKPGYNKIP